MTVHNRNERTELLARDAYIEGLPPLTAVWIVGDDEMHTERQVFEEDGAKYVQTRERLGEHVLLLTVVVHRHGRQRETSHGLLIRRGSKAEKLARLGVSQAGSQDDS